MKSYYWNEESFGSECPKNWEEIADAANGCIDEYINENPDAEEDEIDNYSENLWKQFCENDEIGGVSAEW